MVPMAKNIQNRIIYPKWIIFLLLAAISGCSRMESQPIWPSGFTQVDRTSLAEHLPTTAPWRDADKPGTIIIAGHYRIYTTIRNPIEQALCARVVEAAWKRFKRMVPAAHINSPLIGYIFRNRREWVAHVKATAGSLAGVYMRIEEGGYEQGGQFAIWRSGVNEMLSVLAHECWHQLSYRTLKNHLPAWLDEGLATQNETFIWRHGRPAFTPWQNQARWSALRATYDQRELIPLHTLVSTQAGSVIMQRAAVVRAYYAEVWSFMLFLKHSRYRNRLLAVLRRAQRGTLNKLLSGAGLSPQDITLQTVRWNSIAGPVFLRDCISHHPAILQKRYLAFVRKLLSAWPTTRMRTTAPQASP